MSNSDKNRTPLDRLVRFGWDALDAARRREPLTLDKLTQNARDTVESARKGLFNETALKALQFRVPVDNGVSAHVELELSVGEARVFVLPADGDVLLDADLMYLGSLSFGVEGDTQRQVYLRQSTQVTVGWANPIHWTTRPRWDVGLTPRLPLDLRVRGGVGEADLNLTGVRLQSLQLDGNIGPINVTLPGSGPGYSASLRGAAGPIAVNVPENAAGVVNVRTGVGGLAVNIAPEAAVRIQIRGGVGQVHMPPGFSKMEATAPGLTNTGTWETPNFTQAARQVTIHMESGIVGNIHVRVLDAE